MSSFFKDRVYVVSGGSTGIGLAVTKALLSEGAKVSIGSVTIPENLSGDLKEFQDRVLITNADVSSKESVESWIKATVEKWGHLDGAANVAGVVPKDHNQEKIETVTDESWNFVMGVNGYGILNCLRAETKYLGKDGRNGAAVVNVGSGLSLIGKAGAITYTASKHAVLGITRAVAKELGSKGVRVNCVAPGFIDTETMTSKMTEAMLAATFRMVPLNRAGKTSEIADVIVYLLSDKASFVNATCVTADGGLL